MIIVEAGKDKDDLKVIAKMKATPDVAYDFYGNVIYPCYFPLTEDRNA